MNNLQESLPLSLPLAKVTWSLAERVLDMASRLLSMLELSMGEKPPTDFTRVQSFLHTYVEQAEAVMVASRSKVEKNALDRLAEGLSWSPCEVDLVVLAGLADEHEGLAGVLRALHPRGESRPTAGLAAQLFCTTREERQLLRQVLETGSVVRCSALSLVGDVPLFDRSLVLGEALWSALLGIDLWPASVERQNDSQRLAGLEEWLVLPSVQSAVRALAGGHRCTVLVTGESEEIAFHRAHALARVAELRCKRVRLPVGTTPALMRLVELHALARNVLPLVNVPMSEGPDRDDLAFFENYPGPAVLCTGTSPPALHGARPVLALAAPRLSATSRKALWKAAIPDLEAQADVLAARYAIEAGTIAEVTADITQLEALEGRKATLDDVAQSVRTRSAVGLASGVSLIQPKVDWADLVLHKSRLTQLQEAVARQLHQARVLDQWGFLSSRPGSRGVRMLFSGSPGTGKTLSAEVIAHALGVDLLMIDLSRLVSKWIGETEKHLSAIFDLAESAQAVLLFDEADALFGKRTEVSDAHDHYANLQTAYLLSRLERFEGLAVLSTNLRRNIDPAFVRRLEFIVDFGEPGSEERLRLWKCHIPRKAPLADDVNLTELAELYPVVGGFIRNAAVAAGFLAAADNGPIAYRHFIQAIQREYEKSGRTFPGAPSGMRAR